MNRIVAAIFIATFGMIWSSSASPPISSRKEAAPIRALPAPFTDYELLPESRSPNGKFAVIYPKRDKIIEATNRGAARLVLVTLSPFHVLCDIPRGCSALTFGHGSYAFAWRPDSSAFLMVQGIRWGPERVYLAELENPAHPRLTDLAALVAERVRPAFEASKKPRYNGTYDFIFDVEERRSSTGGWDFTNSGDVAIDCTCTNNPKPDTQDVWKLRWKGTWSRVKRTLMEATADQR